MKRSRLVVLPNAAAFAITFSSLPLIARADVPITQIAVTGTAAPDGGTFTSFEAPTADRQTNFDTGFNPFYFEATNSNGVTGVYYYTFNTTGQLLEEGTVADSTMTAATGGTFSSFTSLSSGYGELGFIGTDSNGTQGVYAIGSFPLTLIATPTTLTPSGVAFGNFQNISIMSDYNYGAKGGEIESDAGIYDFYPTTPTTFTFAANTSTTPPGATGPFTSFGPVSFKNLQESGLAPGITATVRAVIATAGGVEGVYGFVDSSSGGEILASAPLVNLANVGRAIPSGIGHFTSFGNPIATSNEIAFTAHYSTASGDQQGIFVYGPYEDGSGLPVSPPIALDQIVATGQIAPNSGGATFTGFSDLTDDSYYQIFIASLSSGQEGLFVSTNISEYYYNSYVPDLTQINEVIETGDTLDGKIVSGIELAPDASDYPVDLGPGLIGSVGPDAFLVDFTDGSQGLFYFTGPLPEPASLALLSLTLILLRRKKLARG